MNLTDLGLKYGTDKATHHGYTEHYHERFKDIRMDVKNVLEIGTAKGHAKWASSNTSARVKFP